MASVSSISSVVQYGMQQIMVQQAKRNADQLEQTAQSLQSQANDAQRVAERALEDARSLAIQSDQAQQRAGQALQGLAALSAQQQSSTRLVNAINGVAGSQQTAAATTPSTSSSSPSPVVNSQGQVTGKTINTTA
ncbi:MAG TPA: alanine-zipper protein [Rhodocyclaceae bacterium]|nr:alanine-zipper protein [Rhodocyclaceae bacterium]